MEDLPSHAPSRNCRPISVKWPHFDRLDGNNHPSLLPPARVRSTSHTRSLMGIVLLPSAVLLSGTKIIRLFQSRFPRKDNDVPKQLEHASLPIARACCDHQLLFRMMIQSQPAPVLRQQLKPWNPADQIPFFRFVKHPAQRSKCTVGVRCQAAETESFHIILGYVTQAHADDFRQPPASNR